MYICTNKKIKFKNMYDLSNYVKTLKESEVPNVGLVNVSSRSLINKHQM